jgi:deoxyribodipyrimidine photo-lyase
MSIAGTRKTVAIWWVKRDFRLNDNEALFSALASNDIVLPIFVFEPLLMNGPDWGAFHTKAISEAAESLSNNLNHFNSKLLAFHVSPMDAIKAVNQKLNASGYHVNEVYSHEETGLTHTFKRDREFKRWCQQNAIKWHEFTSNGVIRGPINRNYWEKRFTSYMMQDRIKFTKNKLILSFPDALKKILSDHFHDNALMNTSSSFSSEYMNVSERSGTLILKDFLGLRGKKYRGGISSMNKATEACSRLSAQIAWGSLSLRTVLQECDRRLNEIEAQNSMTSKQWRASLGNFRSRLFWHSHFVQKLENQVDMEFYAVNKAFRDGLPYIHVEVDPQEHDKRLQAWLHGETGFPAIDAAMRYYQKFGWLNFRSRAMITSFACNALRLPWQTILYELSKLMVDYVPGIHVSQVQMQAGVTGINTIRVYSPQKQLQDHDPKCSFVYSMIPELRSLKPVQILSLSNEFSTSKYTKQIIDFKSESRIMKDALYKITKSQDCVDESKKVFIKHGSRRRNFSSRRKANDKVSKSDSSQLKLF